jgi:hypothetical protein
MHKAFVMTNLNQMFVSKGAMSSWYHSVGTKYNAALWLPKYSRKYLTRTMGTPVKVRPAIFSLQG